MNKEMKARLRQEMRSRLQMISAEERNTASIDIYKQLVESVLWSKSSVLLLYSPLPDEVDIWPVLLTALQQKTVALPCHNSTTDTYEARVIKNPDHDVVSGKYGIRQPSLACPIIPLIQLDLALVPGLGYSESGVRLGRGQGYYDRMLAGFPGVKCGIGYDWQVGLPIPAAEHDIRLNCILTPTRWHWVPERGS